MDAAFTLHTHATPTLQKKVPLPRNSHGISYLDCEPFDSHGTNRLRPRKRTVTSTRHLLLVSRYFAEPVRSHGIATTASARLALRRAGARSVHSKSQCCKRSCGSDICSPPKMGEQSSAFSKVRQTGMRETVSPKSGRLA